MYNLDNLPSTGCIRCGRCCGIIPVVDSELAIIEKYVKDNGISPVVGYNFFICPFLSEDNECLIYSVRPSLCRLMGHVRGLLACPNGCNSFIPSKEASKMAKTSPVYVTLNAHFYDWISTSVRKDLVRDGC